MRDDFSSITKDTLARRVNFLCSNPHCPVATTGPHSDPEKAVNRGVAAHITAAAQGGKRYDASLTPEQRSKADNGIWLCHNCAKLIDSDENRFTVSLLRAWKVIAEAKADHSLQSNAPLGLNAVGHQIRLRGSYAGGSKGTHVSLTVFNGGASPFYLAAWHAEWSDHRACFSLKCVQGELPFRLQSQDSYMLVVDLGDRGFTGLTQVGLVDGAGQYISVGETDTLRMVQDAKRYSALLKTPDYSTLEEKLRECEVDIHAEVETTSYGAKTLVIRFANKSDTPIPLVGCRIEWRYNPPRTQPRGSDATGPVSEVEEIGGSVDVACRESLSSPVSPGKTIEFYVHPHFAGVLMETLFDDVKDEDIAITFGTITRYGWTAIKDEIPGTVREFARHVVDSRQPK